MKILFLSLSRFDDVNVRGIYSDLMREFIRRGNEVFIASPTERRFGKPTHLIDSENCHILKIKTLNIQKINIIEKGIGTLLLEYQFDSAIRKYWGNVKFDLVLYATPPITFNRVIERIKRRCGARSYLMLKDIFPQNAVDLGMMKEGGFLHRMFRKKEERLYQISDRIGCMSLLGELNIPVDKTIFIYGGNLGKPQGIDFLLEVVTANEKRDNSYIIIVGNGTEYPKIEKWFSENNPKNAKLLSALPKDKYDNLIRAAHVGLIFGMWSLSGDIDKFMANMDELSSNNDRTTAMGSIGQRYLIDNYSIEKTADIIIKSL